VTREVRNLKLFSFAARVWSGGRLAEQARNEYITEAIGMAENVLTVTDNSFEQEVLKSEVPVLVDFWAEWCGPCHMVAPTVEAIANDYSGKIRVAKVNVDENAQIPNRYGIRVKEQLVGNHPRDNIEKAIEKHV
jgi:thioredoxin 1